MTIAAISSGLRAALWRDKSARSLREAALAACAEAEAEHLPVHACVSGDRLRWHAEAMLKTGHVHGKSGPQSGLLSANSAADLATDLSRVTTESGDWCELTVERRDFDAYLKWLRTVW